MNISWLGNQGCNPNDPDGLGYRVEWWEDGSLRSKDFRTYSEAEQFILEYDPVSVP